MGFALLFQRVQHVNTLAKYHGEQKEQSGGELNWRAMQCPSTDNTLTRFYPNYLLHPAQFYLLFPGWSETVPPSVEGIFK